MAEPKKYLDLVNRGSRERSPLGTATFIGLRALDGFWLQRLILVDNPLPRFLARFGISPPLPPPAGIASTLSTLDASLTPYQSVLWAMAIGAAVKQIFWMSYIAGEPLYPRISAQIALYNTVANGINTLAFAYAAANPTWNPTAIYVGVPIYIVGILIETISEVQRKWFKDDPKNKGKPYSGGLFGLSRSINYFGYTLWRAGFALAGGGWVWGIVLAGLFSYDFTTRAIPALDQYCSKRYGAQWAELKRKVPYAYCPGRW